MSSGRGQELCRRTVLGGLGAGALAACAPMVQKVGAPPLGFAGPRLDPMDFVTADGVSLPMDVWAPQGEPWAVMVALHGMNDYANAFAHAAPWWAEQGIATYAYDQRGFGRAPERGVWGGADAMAGDLKTICTLVRARHPGAVLGVLGHSMGGAVAITAFASEDPPDVDRLILAAPGVWGWSRQALPQRLLLWTAAHIVPGWRVSPPDWLARRIRASDNTEILLAMGRDRNMIFDTRIDAIYGLVDLMQRADEGLKRVRERILYLYGAKDQIVPKEATLHAAKGLKPQDRSAYYAEGWHLLTRDLQAPKVWADIESYLRDPDAPLPSGAPPLPQA